MLRSPSSPARLSIGGTVVVAFLALSSVAGHAFTLIESPALPSLVIDPALIFSGQTANLWVTNWSNRTVSVEMAIVDARNVNTVLAGPSRVTLVAGGGKGLSYSNTTVPTTAAPSRAVEASAIIIGATPKLIQSLAGSMEIVDTATSTSRVFIAAHLLPAVQSPATGP